MSRAGIAFSTLGIPELLQLHNTLAQQSGERTVKTWTRSRMDLVQRVAILRTLPHTKHVAIRAHEERSRPLTLFILAALAFVDKYEDAKGAKLTRAEGKRRIEAGDTSIIKVGLYYGEVLARVRKRFPESRTSVLMLRQMAWQLRNREPKNGIHPDDFDRFPMPHKRPIALPVRKEKR